MITLRKKQAGLSYMLIGLFLVAVGLFNPLSALATVTIDTIPPAIYAIFPNSPLSGSPTPLEPSKTYELLCQVDLEKPPEVWVEIDGVRSDMAYKEMYTQYDYNYYKYSITWTAPSTDATIKFVFKAKDAAGNIGSAVPVYGAVVTVVPEGSFYINDKLVAKDASVTFNTRTLKFTFKATKYPDKITSVGITVVNQLGFTLAKGGDGVTWDGYSWTAPGDGTYTIYGKISVSGKEFTYLSILVNVDSFALLPSSWPFSPLRTLLMGVGGLLTAYGIRKRRGS
jgi:hypothetical protein